MEHSCVQGDTYNSIALRYGVSVAKLKKLNHSFGSEPYLGQVLKIPVDDGSILDKTVTIMRGNENDATVNNISSDIGNMNLIEKKSDTSITNEIPKQQQQVENKEKQSENNQMEPISIPVKVCGKKSKSYPGELVITPHFIYFDTKSKNKKDATSTASTSVNEVGEKRLSRNIEFCIDMYDISGCSARVEHETIQAKKYENSLSSTDSDGVWISWRDTSAESSVHSQDSTAATSGSGNISAAAAASVPKIAQAFLVIVWKNEYFGFVEEQTVQFMLDDLDYARTIVQIIHDLMQNKQDIDRQSDPSSRFTYGEFLEELHIQGSQEEESVIQFDNSYLVKKNDIKETRKIEAIKARADFGIEVFPSPSLILSHDIMLNEIPKYLPERLRFSRWTRIYDFNTHGISLERMFELSVKSKTKEFILVVQTQNNDALGVFTTEPWNKKNLGFYGSGETFVFSVFNSSVLRNGKGKNASDAKEIFNGYSWTEKNQFFQTSSLDHIGVGGGGGGFALAIDGDLSRGTTNACDTFGNKSPLTQNKKAEFSIYNMEVWTLTSHGIDGNGPKKQNHTLFQRN